jgi:ankyrin repeat protein
MEVQTGTHNQATSLPNTIHGAASLGNLDKVTAFLASGVEVDSRDNWGITALQYAASKGHLHVMAALIQAGANVNETSSGGDTALHVAAWYNGVNALYVLLEAGAAVNTKDMWGRTALHAAASNGNKNSIFALIEAGAEIDTQDENGITALHRSASNGWVISTLLLVEAGAAIDAQEENGRTALGLSRLFCSQGETVAKALEISLTSTKTRRTNVLARASRFQVLDAFEAATEVFYFEASTDGLYESLLVRVLLAVSDRVSISESRLVCKTWRRVSDCTLKERTSEFFAPKKDAKCM